MQFIDLFFWNFFFRTRFKFLITFCPFGVYFLMQIFFCCCCFLVIIIFFSFFFQNKTSNAIQSFGFFHLDSSEQDLSPCMITFCHIQYMYLFSKMQIIFFSFIVIIVNFSLSLPILLFPSLIRFQDKNSYAVQWFSF